MILAKLREFALQGVNFTIFRISEERVYIAITWWPNSTWMVEATQHWHDSISFAELFFLNVVILKTKEILQRLFYTVGSYLQITRELISLTKLKIVLAKISHHKYNICSKLSDTDDDNYDDVMKVC